MAQPPYAIAGRARRDSRVFWCAAACALLGFALYANTLHHGYALDDEAVVTTNPDVLAGLRGIPNILRAGIWHFQNVNLGYYRPLSLVTFAVENQFWPGNAHAEHWGNVLLYAATGFFLCLLLSEIFRGWHPVFPLLAAALFLAHPIHTEVVANVKSRDELLSFLNLAIALLLLLRFYARPESERRPSRLAPSLLFFYLALLSKETAIIGLFIAPAALYFSDDGLPAGWASAKTCLRRAAPWLASAAAFQIQKVAVLGSAFGAVPHDIANYPYAIARAELPSTFMILSWCVKLMLFPVTLRSDYAYDQIPAAGYLTPMALLGLPLAAALAWFGLRGLKERSPLALGVFLFDVSLAPALGFVFLRGGILAERLLYTSALGFGVVATLLLADWAQVPLRSPQAPWAAFWRAPRFAVPLAAILVLFSFRTGLRNPAWRDNFTLFSTDAQTSPNNCQARRHYGSQLIDASIFSKDPQRKKALFDQGLSELRAALAINPHMTAVWFKFGVAYHWATPPDYASAIYYYSRAIAEEPNAPGSAGAYNNLGAVYDRIGKQELASFCFNKSLAVNPYFQDALTNHRSHMKRTGLDVRRLPPGTRLDSGLTDSTDQDEKAMTRVLWGPEALVSTLRL